MFPYQNQSPNYYSQYMPTQAQQPQYNPYLQRMENLQQFQQTLNLAPVQMQNQFPALGKMVESMEVARTTEIPMDGNTYYFPKADGSMVYGKRWLSNGTTEIISYKPYFEENEQNPMGNPSDEIKSQFGAFGEVLGAIQNDIRMLFDKVDKLSKPTRQKGGGELE